MTLTNEQIDEAIGALAIIAKLKACIEDEKAHDAMCRNIMVINTALEMAKGNVWQPIETAPKDGGMFLVCLPRMMDLIIRARFDRVHKQWLTDLESQGLDKVHFFHPGDVWQPLPTPPKESE